nr:MAG TPA: hypothetical protein [Caudoviricetes sp.]
MIKWIEPTYFFISYLGNRQIGKKMKDNLQGKNEKPRRFKEPNYLLSK